ncbi:MAG TPA: hypothetical protein VMT93_02650 [Gemmatimonadaceae bacterium]|nr:hypothetical protein [Gemmatimonadaceae bacterium]
MIQEIRTSMAPAAVLAAAKEFFPRQGGIYAAYPEKEGPGYVTFRGQGGEEIVIGAVADGNATAVRGSTYLFDQQVGRFLTSLEPLPLAEQVTG